MAPENSNRDPFYISRLRLNEQITKKSPSLGRDAVYMKKSLISRLPAYLTVQFVRFQYKGKEAINAKILKDIKFPIDFDAFDLCTPELQQKMVPMRSKFKEQEDAALLAKENVKQIKKNEKPVEKKTRKEAFCFEDGEDFLSCKISSILIDYPNFSDLGSNNSGYYTLQAVLTHKGRSSSSGHYVGWVRQKGDNWMMFDDDNVSPVTTEDILKLSGGGDWHIS